LVEGLMSAEEREWLKNKLREAFSAGNLEKADKIADLLRGTRGGPTQETLREDEAIADVQPFEPDLDRLPIPEVPTGEEVVFPPQEEDETLLGRAQEFLYPGRSEDYLEDAFVGGIKRFAASEGEALAQGATEMVRDRENWRAVGEVSGWALATMGSLIQGPAVLEPTTTATQIALTGPPLAAGLSGLMDGLYQQFMTEGIDLEEVSDGVRSSLIWNSLFSVAPSMAKAVADAAAKRVLGVTGKGKKDPRVLAETKAWINDVWRRYQMVKGAGVATPDPSASGMSRLVTGSKALGRIPVFVGTWYQVRREQNLKKTLDWWAGKLENLAPVYDVGRLGKQFTKNAEAMGKWMLESVSGLYEGVFKAAATFDKKYAARGGIVPTAKLREFAADLTRRYKLPYREKPHFSAAEMAEYAKTGKMPDKMGAEMNAFTPDQWALWVHQNMTGGPAFTTMERIKNLKMMLSDAVRKTVADPAQDTRMLRGALDAVQGAIQEMRVVAESSGDDAFKAFAAKSRFADEYFIEVRTLMERPAAQKFHKFDRHFWEHAHIMGNYNTAGSKYADEMFDVAFSTNSASHLRDLRNLVGDEAYNNSRRKYLGDIFRNSYVGEGGDAIFNVKRFRELLQIDGRPEVFSELMRGSGIKKKEMEGLIKNMGDYDITFNAAKMQLRRAAIGGVKSVVGGFQPMMAFGQAGAGAATAGAFDLSWWIPVIGVIALRSMGKIATSPWAFKRLAEFAEAERNYFSQKISKLAYGQALDKVLRYFPDENEVPYGQRLGLPFDPSQNIYDELMELRESRGYNQ
jgi:hypothetical protein